MAFLRKWLGLMDTEDDERERVELEEAKHALNHERGIYRQAVQRMEVRSNNLMKTWEAANGMIKGGHHD